MSADLFQQGVEAFQAGDKVRAKTLLLQATAADPQNENAWYYLAAAETDSGLRRQYLERVLEINPNHERAQQVMARLDASGSAPAEPSRPAESDSTQPPASSSRRATPIRPLDPKAGDTPGGDPSGGFLLPVTIPGAPSQVSLGSLLRGGWQLFQRGLDVLQRKAGVYEAEVAQATWWRFWLLVGFGYAITALLATVNMLLLQSRLSAIGFRFNFLAVLVVFLLTLPVGMITLYAGVYASHWWAKRQGGSLSLYQHAYAVALPYVPAYVIGAVVGVVFGLLGIGSGLITLLISLYGLYIMTMGFENLYRFSDPNQKYFTVGMMFVGFIVAGIVIGMITSVIFGVSVFVAG